MKPDQKWLPTDNQMVQMLLNRGHLDNRQVALAKARQAAVKSPSLLQTIVDLGYVSDEDVRTGLQHLWQDRLCRQSIERLSLMTSRELADATRLQHGTRRTLLQTIIQERCCTHKGIAELLNELNRLTRPPQDEPAIAPAQLGTYSA